MALRYAVFMALVALTISACRTGTPILDRGEKPPSQSGTIAGHVRTGSGAPVVSRVVRAIAVSTGQTFETTTGNVGSYTLMVPPGRYRIEVQLRDGERVAKEPGETRIDPSDLDEGRDFVIDVGR